MDDIYGPSTCIRLSLSKIKKLTNIGFWVNVQQERERDEWMDGTHEWFKYLHIPCPPEKDITKRSLQCP